MGATAVLSSTDLSVEPGGEVELTIRVRNTGSVVDQFRFEVVGEPAGWVTFEPDTVSLFPGAEGTVVARFRPPRSPTTRAGTVPFAIKVTPQEDEAGAVAEEGVLQVAVFRDLFAELIPRTAKGRRRARFSLALDNRGNAPVNANLKATDPDDQMAFSFRPGALTTPPGGAAFSTMEARPRKAFLRGPDATRPFQALVETDDDGEPVVADGTLLHQALIPRWLPRALMGAAAALVVLVALWLTLLKPTVKSTARVAAQEAVQAPLAEASKQIADLAEMVGAPVPPPLAPEAGATTTTIAPTAGPGLASGGDPFDGRLEVTAANQNVAFTVPADTTLFVTDMVLENPDGDSGEVRVQRGNANLLVLRLDNFRDLDYHFVTPMVFTAGQTLRFRAACNNAAPPAGGAVPPCTPALYFGGFTRAA